MSIGLINCCSLLVPPRFMIRDCLNRERFSTAAAFQPYSGESDVRDSLDWFGLILLRGRSHRRIMKEAIAMNATMRGACVPAICLAAVFMGACSRSEPKAPNSWDQKAAAAYLDQRAGWWMEWSAAARDHGTFCVSCHTAVPYALSRPALRQGLAEQAPSANERRLLDNVTKRVRLWKEVAPFYSDADRGAYKSVESRGTES